MIRKMNTEEDTSKRPPGEKKMGHAVENSFYRITFWLIPWISTQNLMRKRPNSSQEFEEHNLKWTKKYPQMAPSRESYA